MGRLEKTDPTMSIPDLCKQFRKQKVVSFLAHLKKDNCSDCQNAVRTIRLESKVKLITKKALWFLVGVLVSPLVLYFVATFWPFWPSSHVYVFTSGLRPQVGNAAGCLVYMVSISTDRGFDDAYLKIRFPMKISDLRAGTTPSDALSAEKFMSMSIGEIGRGANGNCKIFQTAGEDESEVTSKIIQRAVVIQLAKAQANTIANALVVGNDERDPDKSEPPVVHEGYFTTSLLAYPARRSMSFSDNAAQAAK